MSENRRKGVCVTEPVLGPSGSSTAPWHGASALSANARRAARSMWRPQWADRWTSVRGPTQIERATARPFCRPWVSGHADACTHRGAQGLMRPIYNHRRWKKDFAPSVEPPVARVEKFGQPGKIAGSRCGCGSGVGHGARKWRGRSTRPIFDHRETAAGVCRLPRTVCENVGER